MTKGTRDVRVRASGGRDAVVRSNRVPKGLGHSHRPTRHSFRSPATYLGPLHRHEDAAQRLVGKKSSDVGKQWLGGGGGR